MEEFSVLGRMVREDFPEEVAYKQPSKRSEGVN